MVLPDNPVVVQTAAQYGTYENPPNTAFIPTLYLSRGPISAVNNPVDGRQFEVGNCHDSQYFIMGDSDYHIWPYVMYTNEGSGDISDLLAEIIGFIGEVATPFRALTTGTIGVNPGIDQDLENLSSLSDVVTKIFDFAAGGDVRVVLGEPIDLQNGRTTISTETHRVDIDVSSDPSYLMGTAHFIDAYNDVFEPLLVQSANQYAEVEKTRESCRSHDIALRAAGLRDRDSAYDRAYIMLRHLHDLQVSRDIVLACLTGPNEMLIPAALDRSERHLMYGFGMSHVEETEVETHLAVFSRRDPSIVTPVPTPAPEDNKIGDLVVMHQQFGSAVAAAATRAEFSETGQGQENTLFLPEISVDEVIQGEVFNVDGGPLEMDRPFEGQPYEVFRRMYDAGYTATDCRLLPDNISDDFQRSAVFGSSEIAFLFINQRIRRGGPIAEDSTLLARVFYEVDDNRQSISQLELMRPPPLALKEFSCLNYGPPAEEES